MMTSKKVIIARMGGRGVKRLRMDFLRHHQSIKTKQRNKGQAAFDLIV